MEVCKPSSTYPINRDELLARVDHDYELLRDLVNLFKRDLPLQMAALHRAIANEDHQAAERTSHTLKGMFLSLAASEAGASAAKLEDLSRHSEKTAFPKALALLETEVARLIPQLEACLVKTEA